MNLYSMWKLSSVARLRPKTSSKSKKSRTRSTQGDEKEDLSTDNDNESHGEKEVPSLSVSEVELLLEMKNFVMDYLRDMLIIAPNDLNESLDTVCSLALCSHLIKSIRFEWAVVSLTI